MPAILGKWENMRSAKEGVSYLSGTKARAQGREMEREGPEPGHRVEAVLCGGFAPEIRDIIDDLPPGPEKVRRAAGFLEREAWGSRTARPAVRNTLSFAAEEWKGFGTTDAERDAKAAEYVGRILRETGLEGQSWYAVRHMDTPDPQEPNPHYHLTINLVRDGVRLDPGRSFFGRARDAVQAMDRENGIAPALTRAQGNLEAVGYLRRDQIEEMKALGLDRREYAERTRGFTLQEINHLAEGIRAARGWDDVTKLLEAGKCQLVRDARRGGGRIEGEDGRSLPLSKLGKLDGLNMSLKNLEARFGALPNELAGKGLARDEWQGSPRRIIQTGGGPQSPEKPVSGTAAIDALIDEAATFVRLHRTPNGSAWQVPEADDFEKSRDLWALTKRAFKETETAIRKGDYQRAARLRADAFRKRAEAMKEQQRAAERREARKLWAIIFDDKGRRRTEAELSIKSQRALLAAFARIEGNDLAVKARYAGISTREAKGMGDALTKTRREYSLAVLGGDTKAQAAKAAELAGIRADAADRAARKVQEAGKFNLGRELMDEIAEPLISIMTVPAALVRLKWAMTHPAQVATFLAKTAGELATDPKLMPDKSARKIRLKLDAIERARAIHQGGRAALDALTGRQPTKEPERPAPTPQDMPTTPTAPVVPGSGIEATDKAKDHARARSKEEKRFEEIEAARAALDAAKRKKDELIEQRRRLPLDANDPKKFDEERQAIKAALARANPELPGWAETAVNEYRATRARSPEEARKGFNEAAALVIKQHGRQVERAFTRFLRLTIDKDDAEQAKAAIAHHEERARAAELELKEAQARALTLTGAQKVQDLTKAFDEQLLTLSPNDLTPDQRQRQADLRKKRERELEMTRSRKGPEISF